MLKARDLGVSAILCFSNLSLPQFVPRCTSNRITCADRLEIVRLVHPKSSGPRRDPCIGSLARCVPHGSASYAHSPAQRLATTRQARANGADRNTENRGNLLVTHPLKTHEKDHCLCFAGREAIARSRSRSCNEATALGATVRVALISSTGTLAPSLTEPRMSLTC